MKQFPVQFATECWFCGLCVLNDQRFPFIKILDITEITIKCKSESFIHSSVETWNDEAVTLVYKEVTVFLKS